MNSQTLSLENIAFAGTRGISQNNCHLNFKPAFLDKTTGRIEIPKLRDGMDAPMHIISWLPAEWATCLDEEGSVQELKSGVIAGFERDGCFFTRDEAAEL